MKLASVVLDIPTQALDSSYTYSVPDNLPASPFALEVGCAVQVSFRARKAVGFVTQISECADGETPDGVDAAKLKPIEAVLSHAYFNEAAVACAQWLSEYYIAPLSVCVRLFTPPGAVPRIVRDASGQWQVREPEVGKVDDRWVLQGECFAGFAPRKGAVKQQSICEALACGELRLSELTREFGAVSAVLSSLEKKGVVRIERRRRFRGVCEDSFSEGSVFAPTPKHLLNAEQQAAFEGICRACSRGAGEVILLDGVTGSGKTEVYLQALEEVLSQGRTGLVLVPEISLTPQTVARFRGRFGDAVAVMHSRMSQGERFDQWDFIRSGQAKVVVGARSALFTPLANLGLIIIDEEHEGSYKQDQAPRYHARDVAVWMARQAGATVVLGSATPSIESLHACETRKDWHLQVLSQRANGKPLPQVRVVDMAQEFGSGSRSMFAYGLSQALVKELAAGHKAVLMLNQRGFAKFVLCRSCGFVPECPSCSTSLTFHERGNALMCHHCGHQVPAPPRCPVCGSPYLRKFGAGTQRVEDELRALLDSAPLLAARERPVPIIRMDADTTAGKGAHRKLLEEFASQEAAVLLGTQMIAKGLDFDEVTLVGVINADTTLKLPDYRAAERTFDLIEQVAGRAGRADLSGKVFVQTYQAQASAVRAAAQHNRGIFLAEELPKRKALGYPPYVRMANILAWGKDEQAVRKCAEGICADLREFIDPAALPGWLVMPAVPCALAKLRGTYRWHVLVKCPPEAKLSGMILPYFRQRKPLPDVSLAVDIDPYDLL